jgi:transposase-like protein
VVPVHRRVAPPHSPGDDAMSVPLPDGSPKRLVQHSIPAADTATSGKLRTLVQRLIEDVMQAAFARLLGTAPHLRTGAHLGARHATRLLTLVTRVGKVALTVPQDRVGAFAPTVFL